MLNIMSARSLPAVAARFRRGAAAIAGGHAAWIIPAVAQRSNAVGLSAAAAVSLRASLCSSAPRLERSVAAPSAPPAPSPSLPLPNGGAATVRWGVWGDAVRAYSCCTCFGGRGGQARFVPETDLSLRRCPERGEPDSIRGIYRLCRKVSCFGAKGRCRRRRCCCSANAGKVMPAVGAAWSSRA